jgi:hypothetical protein
LPLNDLLKFSTFIILFVFDIFIFYPKNKAVITYVLVSIITDDDTTATVVA